MVLESITGGSDETAAHEQYYENVADSRLIHVDEGAELEVEIADDGHSETFHAEVTATSDRHDGEISGNSTVELAVAGLSQPLLVWVPTGDVARASGPTSLRVVDVSVLNEPDERLRELQSIAGSECVTDLRESDGTQSGADYLVEPDFETGLYSSGLLAQLRQADFAISDVQRTDDGVEIGVYDDDE